MKLRKIISFCGTHGKFVKNHQRRFSNLAVLNIERGVVNSLENKDKLDVFNYTNRKFVLKSNLMLKSREISIYIYIYKRKLYLKVRNFKQVVRGVNLNTEH